VFCVLVETTFESDDAEDDDELGDGKDLPPIVG
jgi:hypothetical protein